MAASTPASFARVASTTPSSCATATGDSPVSPAPSVLADASVVPVRSSMSCAYVCRFERNTVKRGVEAVPETFRRIPRFARSRRSAFLFVAIAVCCRFSIGLRSCLPFAGRTRPRSAPLCPYMARADAGRGSSPKPAPPSVDRFLRSSRSCSYPWLQPP